MVQGLKIAEVEEKIGLYTDDLILFLADPGESLSSSLAIIEESGYYSGLTVNIKKSLLFLIDRSPNIEPPSTLPTQRFLNLPRDCYNPLPS